MESDTPTSDFIAAECMNTLSLKSDFASWWAHKEIPRLRAELAAAIKQRDDARDYSIALQRAIEHHCRGVAVPPAIAANCPHHAQMLNEHLASKEGGGA